MKKWVCALVLSLGFYSLPTWSDSPILAIEEYAVEWQGVPRDPFVAPDGSVWFCGQAGNYLARFSPDTNQFKRYELPEGTHPHNLIIDAEGMVWYAGNRNAHIGRLQPKDGSIKKIAMPDKVTDPHTLVFDRAGNIWFTAQHSNVLGYLDTTSLSVKIYPVSSKRARPYGIKMSPQDRPWAVLLGTHKLATVDKDSEHVREVDLPRKDARPRRLEITGDGQIWMVDYAEGYLTRYSPEQQSFKEWPMPGGRDSRPYGTVLDHRGRIWIAETRSYPNRLVGFDTATSTFLGAQTVNADGTIRHIYFDNRKAQFWFGIDSGVLARAKPLEPKSVP